MNLTPEQSACRCGWPGTGPHRCHRGRHDGDDVRCQNEGTPRTLLVALPLGSHALAGMQMKFAAQSYETVGCDACWAHYLERVRAEQQGAQSMEVSDA